MSQQQVRRQKLDTGIGEDPDRYILSLYTQFLQALFNFMPVGHFHWEPDDEQTEIVITTSPPLNPEVVEKAPALVVLMGPCQWQGLSIGQMLTFDQVTGKKVSTDLRSGYFVVYAVASNELVARRIAQVVEIYTRIHQPLLEGEGGFHQVGRPAPSLNAPSPPGALVNGNPQGLVMVQVNMPFTYQWTWSTEPGRQLPQYRSLDMVTQEERAVDYPYRAPNRLERMRLSISTVPLLVRRISGRRAVSVEVTGAIRPFQLADLRPPPGDYEE